MSDKKRDTTTTPETGSEKSAPESKLERLNQALSFAENSMKEVRSALDGAGSIREVYERDLDEAREQLKKSDTNNIRLRERMSEQEGKIVELRQAGEEKDERIDRLEAEMATLRRAKANLEKTLRREGADTDRPTDQAGASAAPSPRS